MVGQKKILIVEDELVIAHTIKEMLHDVGYGQIDIARDHKAALKAIEYTHFDLAFLDINLGSGGEGIRLSRDIRQRGINFIYLTSYSDRITMDQALETKPSAYLNKPILPHSLYSAAAIALDQQVTNHSNTIKLEDGNRIIIIPIDDIHFIHAENNYVKVVSKEKNYLIRMPLAKIIDELDSNQFIQVHRSYVVNMNKVTCVESNTIRVKNIDIPVSRSHRLSVRSRFMTEV